MNIDKIDNGDEIIKIWEESVRATHDFVKEEDLMFYKKTISDGKLKGIELYGIKKDDKLAAFMGIKGEKIEMLFVKPDYFCQGIGRLMVNYAKDVLMINEVDVNEQNIGAVKFYQSLGFKTIDRKDKDDAGFPYPILKLTL